MSLSFNVGGVDRAVRLIVGVVLAAVAYFGIVSGVYATIAYIFAVIAFVTGLIKFCPAYTIVGINTRKAKN